MLLKDFADKYLAIEINIYKLLEEAAIPKMITGDWVYDSAATESMLLEKGTMYLERFNQLRDSQLSLLSQFGLSPFETDDGQDYTAEAISWISQIVMRQDRESEEKRE